MSGNAERTTENASCDSPHFEFYTDLALDILDEQFGDNWLYDEAMDNLVASVKEAVRQRQDELDIGMGAVLRSIADAVVGVLIDKGIPF